MKFDKYQHVERLGRSGVTGLTEGTCHVFPKLDGTNASVWLDDEGLIQCGSRRRHLSLTSDNAGFCAFVASGIRPLYDLLYDAPTLRLFGEWLVPHTLKVYREDAWRKFYVFDVMDGDKYVPYEIYKVLLEDFDIDYIPCIAVVEHGRREQFESIAERNDFLMQPGEIGEGVVIKNYDYTNKYGRVTWAKLVRSEFSEQHVKHGGPPVVQGAKTVERDIAAKYVTQTLVDKERAKIVDEGRPIQPQLLGMVWHCILTEEVAEAVKKMKNPTIDFRVLQSCVNARVKEHAKDLF
jgi:hypothetical protein